MSHPDTTATSPDLAQLGNGKTGLKVTRDSWAIRAIGGLCSGSMTSNGRRWLLLASFSVFLIFQLVSLLKAQWLLEAEHRVSTAPVPAPLVYAELALSGFAILTTLTIEAAKRWRSWVLAYWACIVGVRLIMCIFVDEDEPLVIALMVVLLTSGLFAPWSAGWQMATAGMSLIAFTIASFIGVIDVGSVLRAQGYLRAPAKLDRGTGQQ